MAFPGAVPAPAPAVAALTLAVAALMAAAPPPAAAQDAGPAPVVVARVEGSWDASAGQAVLEEAYRRLGVSLEIRDLGGARALEASSTGQVDGELQRIDGISRLYPDLVQVPVPINYLQGAAFSVRYQFPATGWRSLQPYRIGIVEGIIFAAQGTEGMDVTAADDYDRLFDLLESGAIDVAVTPRVNGLKAVADRTAAASAGAAGEREGQIHEMPGVLETLFLYHYLHRSRGDLVPELTRVLSEMLLDGTTRRLREQAYARLGLTS